MANEVTRHDLLRCLQTRVGRANGVPAAALALALDVPARHVRSLVTELRNEGIAVCGQPSTGYFLAQNAEELKDTCDFLRARDAQPRPGGEAAEHPARRSAGPAEAAHLNNTESKGASRPRSNARRPVMTRKS